MSPKATVTLRPESPQDEPFLHRLVIETIAGELGTPLWPEPMRTHLLGIQYTARRQSQRQNFPRAVSHIVEVNQQDAGWLVVSGQPEEIRLVEIMIAPEFRGQGIGTALLHGILAGGAEANKPVRLHVNPTNQRAVRLYERLGFRTIESGDAQHLMECVPSP